MKGWVEILHSWSEDNLGRTARENRWNGERWTIKEFVRLCHTTYWSGVGMNHSSSLLPFIGRISLRETRFFLASRIFSLFLSLYFCTNRSFGIGGNHSFHWCTEWNLPGAHFIGERSHSMKSSIDLFSLLFFSFCASQCTMVEQVRRLSLCTGIWTYLVLGAANSLGICVSFVHNDGRGTMGLINEVNLKLSLNLGIL